MGSASEFLIPLNQPLITFEKWNELFATTKKEDLGRRFGYGFEVPLTPSLMQRYPELENLRQTYNLTDQFYFLITHAKRREFPIHVDGEMGKNNSASINWPLQNCDQNSLTTWYSVETPHYEDIDGTYFLSPSAAAKEIYKAPMLSELNRPYLFRSDIWHSGYCGTTHKSLRVIVKWMTRFNSWGDAHGFFRNKNLLG